MRTHLLPRLSVLAALFVTPWLAGCTPQPHQPAVAAVAAPQPTYHHIGQQTTSTYTAIVGTLQVTSIQLDDGADSFLAQRFLARSTSTPAHWLEAGWTQN